MRRLGAMVIVAWALLIAPEPGAACGDRLLVMGGGVRLDRVVRSRHPGSILFMPLVGADTRDASEQLIAALKQAGHDVRKVASIEEFDRALRERTADVVLADLAQTPALEADSAAANRPLAIVPLLFRPTRAELAAARRQSSCVAPVMGWGMAPVLQVVDQIRARQSAGLALECQVVAPGTT